MPVSDRVARIAAVALSVKAIEESRQRSLAVGPKGETGAQGPRGLRGPQGPKGLQGATGPEGKQGARGERGPQGGQGGVGPQGERGLRGERGLQGERGLAGATGPKGEKGPKGDKGEKGADGRGIRSMRVDEVGDLIVTYTDGATQNVGHVRGEDGGSGTTWLPAQSGGLTEEQVRAIVRDEVSGGVDDDWDEVDW
jgi:hypothetical protein